MSKLLKLCAQKMAEMNKPSPEDARKENNSVDNMDQKMKRNSYTCKRCKKTNLLDKLNRCIECGSIFGLNYKSDGMKKPINYNLNDNAIIEPMLSKVDT